jgi:hypothetical protein
MQIQPLFQTISNLLAGRLFKIPEYQRAYSWGQKQRADLFQDIRKVQQGDNDHFMATMVGLRRGKKVIGAAQYYEFEVVDGQQRLTTITLLLRAILHALKEHKPGKAEAKAAADIQQLLVKGDDLSLLLLQTNHDSSHIFTDYLREGTKPESVIATTTADQNVVDAIKECEEFVAKWAEDSKPIELLGLILNRLTVIFHDIEDEALVYTVFEVLNSRGLDVTWFDKLKAMLMAVVFEYGDRGGKKATIAELHTLWKDVYRTIGLRQSLNRETVRFAGTLEAQERPNRPLGEEAAVVELMRQVGTSSKRAVASTKWVLRVVEAEAKLLSRHRLRAVTDIVQARLVAIAIFLRGFPAGDEAELIRKWETVTFRIYGLANKDARVAVGDYVRLAWQIQNENLSKRDIINGLTQIGQQSAIEEAVGKLSRDDFYKGNGEVLRYFLFRYEEHLAQKAGQKLNESQWNKIWQEEPSKSIEHVMPQSSKTSYMHKLGNLTALPPGVNSKLQDVDPSEKVDTYSSSGLLDTAAIAKVLRKRKWTRGSVLKREKALIEWARDEWSD